MCYAYICKIFEHQDIKLAPEENHDLNIDLNKN